MSLIGKALPVQKTIKVNATDARLLIVYVVNAGWYLRLHWLDRILAIQQTGMRVAVVTNWDDDELVMSLEQRGIRCIHVPFSRRGISLFREVGAYRKLYHVLKELRPDLIHNVTVKPNLYGAMAACRLGIPAASSVTGLGVIFSSKSWQFRIMRSIVLMAYRWTNQSPANRVLFENRDDRALFVVKQVLPMDRTVKVPGAGVDVSFYRPSPEPNSETIVVLFAARLLREKGLPRLVEAIAGLQGEGYDVIARVAGIFDDVAPDAISDREIRDWQQAGLIEWLGCRDDMQDVICQSHIVCLPTTYGEGIPRILIEGAACGRPLVATDISGCNEIIEDGVNGFLVRPEIGHTLSERLAQLSSDRSMRKRMGMAGRAKVVKNYSQEAVVATMLTTYRAMQHSE